MTLDPAKVSCSKADRSSSALVQLIQGHIQSHPNQRIPFVEFMDLALYHPQGGYYNTQAVNMGHRGDFVTAVHLGSEFGELLATQLLECWQILGQPQPFTLVEMGAGQGLLAHHILQFIERTEPTCFSHLHYWIIEQSTTLQQLQQKRLADFPVQWLTWDEIPSAAITGCCFSNELVDAFAVHWVEIQNGTLQEVYVKTSDQPNSPFQEVLAAPSTPALSRYFTDLGIDLTTYPDGYRTEVNLAALDWLNNICDRMAQGYLITMDYGYPSHRYYSLNRREGTLQCYAQHAHHNDPYQDVGNQDITAHVNFTALEKSGTAIGLEKIGFIEQGLFLMALGLGEHLAALSDETGRYAGLDISARLQRRQFLHTLIDPYGMGNFGVLIQGKGLTPEQLSHPLQGLTLPAFSAG